MHPFNFFSDFHAPPAQETGERTKSIQDFLGSTSVALPP